MDSAKDVPQRTGGQDVGDDARVLIIDDHKLFAEALTWALRQRGIRVVGVAATAEEGLAMVRIETPNLVLMDLGLPGTSGLIVGQQIMDELPDVKILAVTALSDPHLIGEAIHEGFHGYVTKQIPMGQLADSIRAVVRGEVVVHPPQGREPSLRRSGREREIDLLAEQLTPREKQVLALLIEGATSAVIGRRLSISPNTVRTHVQSILTKLQVHSRLEAVAFAIRHGIVEVPHDRGPE